MSGVSGRLRLEGRWGGVQCRLEVASGGALLLCTCRQLLALVAGLGSCVASGPLCLAGAACCQRCGGGGVWLRVESSRGVRRP